MHGNTLAAALRKAGADVVLAPVYTPLRTDEENVSIDRLAMGGINIYLDEGLPLWRWMPGLVRRLLDRPSLVSWAAQRGSRTRPEQLGRLTVAMLRSEKGPLKNDVQQLIDWLQAEVRPDIVHLSNVMLAGLARPLGERLGVPVIATLSGEDSFLEKLPAPYYAQARTELRARAGDLAGLVAMCGFYADFMAEYLAVPRETIDVIRPGLNLEGHGEPVTLDGGRWVVGGGSLGGNSQEIAMDGPSEHRAQHGRRVPPNDPKTIGFLSRICADKGLHLLVETLHAMSEAGNAPPYRLRVAGYLDRPGRAYLDQIHKRVRAWGMADRFEYVGELDRPGKIAFLQSLDVLCLSSVIRESKGLPVLEAWASGVPVVLPDHGAFSEMVTDTGGGLLYDPHRPEALSEALGRMLCDDAFATECGRRAQRAVHERYTSQRESHEVLALYGRLCRKGPKEA
ncbi:MAG: glycosyltransferase family 4 protein [Thermoguttaceae bacterium]